MQTKNISNKQLHLLQLLSSRPIDEAILDEVKELMQKRLLEKIDSDMNELWTTNSWSDDTIEKWGSEHLRSSKKTQK